MIGRVEESYKKIPLGMIVTMVFGIEWFVIHIVQYVLTNRSKKVSYCGRVLGRFMNCTHVYISYDLYQISDLDNFSYIVLLLIFEIWMEFNKLYLF